VSGVKRGVDVSQGQGQRRSGLRRDVYGRAGRRVWSLGRACCSGRRPATSSSRRRWLLATGGGCRGSMQHRVGMGSRAFCAGDELYALDQVATVSEPARGAFSIGLVCGGGLKWQHVSPWRAGLHQPQHARLACVPNSAAVAHLCGPSLRPFAHRWELILQSGRLCRQRHATVLAPRPDLQGDFRRAFG
jgi:hypothetical protein